MLSTCLRFNPSPAILALVVEQEPREDYRDFIHFPCVRISFFVFFMFLLLVLLDFVGNFISKYYIYIVSALCMC